MKRKSFLKTAIAIPVASLADPSQLVQFLPGLPKFRRVRPGDPGWPSAAAWDKLKNSLQGDLIKLQSPFTNCNDPAKCNELFSQYKNPYAIGDNPALTQTTGWFNAWTSSPSEYAVAATTSQDVVAAVNFARENKLRLVVKGGGHSYQGTSNSKDSLLIWTRKLNSIQLHDAFIPQGGEGKTKPTTAVSLGSGVVWMQAYNAVTTQAKKYVQGGGCGTVGVAGLIQSGGFGSFSKNYGMAAAGLLEAEVVTADGKLLIVNAFQHPDLFWGLKGGGGGSLAVITRLTLQTRELPAFFGSVSGEIKANSGEAYLRLIEKIMAHYHDNLFNSHWGEQIRFNTGFRLNFMMLFCFLTKEEADAKWKDFIDWISQHSNDYTWLKPFSSVALPAQHLWNAEVVDKVAPGAVTHDNRPGAPSTNTFWTGDLGEAGQYLHAYHSAWMPQELLKKENQHKLAKAIYEASSHWTMSLHFNKGLAGAPPEAIAAAKNTAMNPVVVNSFALCIIAGSQGPSIKGVKDHEPDLATASNAKERIDAAMNEILRIVPNHGSYVSESSFFEKDWQHAYWGANYERLRKVKKKYDPDGLFFVHNGVGSEDWSGDGFEKL